MKSYNDKVKLKKFWRPDGLDFRADLGIIKDAIVVRLCKELLCSKDSFYSIGQSSYFPFPKDYYEKRFDSYIDACELAEAYILDWMRSVLVNSPENESLTLPM